jgi:hypothetical protein
LSKFIPFRPRIADIFPKYRLAYLVIPKPIVAITGLGSNFVVTEAVNPGATTIPT